MIFSLRYIHTFSEADVVLGDEPNLVDIICLFVIFVDS